MNKAVRRGVRLVILESSEGQFALVQVRDGRWVSAKFGKNSSGNCNLVKF